MRSVNYLTGVLLTASLAPLRAASAQTQGALLGPVSVELRAVADSHSYFVYNYTVVNPAASAAGIELVGIDLSAEAGSGYATLPATGPFTHSASQPGVVPAKEHVPVGPISPPRWQAYLGVGGFLDWFGVEGGVVLEDTVPSGATLAGFGFRSPYLPGIRPFRAEPTWQSCCSRPRPPEPDVVPGEHPSPSEFQVQGFTVAPTYPTEDMNLGALRGLLERSCTELGWITHAPICHSLQATPLN